MSITEHLKYLVLALLFPAESADGLPLTILDTERPPAGEKQIILSFDDGPRKGVTDKLLDVLADQGVTAVFFFIGARVKANPDLVRRAAREKHQLGAHGLSSNWPIWFNSDELRGEISRTRRLIEDSAHIKLRTPVLYRPPRGILSPALKSLVERCEADLGYLTFYARDSGAGPDEAGEVLAAIQNRLQEYRGGAIVLHSSRYRGDPERDETVDKSWLPGVVDTLINWARVEGFSFTTYTQREATSCAVQR